MYPSIPHRRTLPPRTAQTVISTKPLTTILGSTHVDESLSGLEEMLFALRLGAFLMPVDDGLVGDDVGIVEHFDNGGKGFHHTSVGVAVDLNCVEQADLGLGTVAERLEYGCLSLARGQ